MHALPPIEAKTLALMDELGRLHAGRPLQALGWTFAWDGAKRRLGACHTMRRGRPVKLLTLSRAYAARNGWAVMEDVARHEIAHALDFEHGGRRGHGATWKAWARACGADPTRLYAGDDLDAGPSKYVARCPDRCGYERAFYRRPVRAYYCPDCAAKRPGDEVAFLQLVVRATGRIVRHGGVETRPDAPGRPTPSRTVRDPKYDGYKYTALCPHCGRMRGYRRSLKRRRACAACCVDFAGGRFDARFELVIRQNY